MAEKIYSAEELKKLRGEKSSPSSQAKTYSAEEVKKLRGFSPTSPLFDPEGVGYNANDPTDISTQRGAFREGVAPLAEGAVVGSGRVAGAALGAPGGPVGATGGGLAGGVGANMLYKNTVQRFFPEWFGKPEETVSKQLGNSVDNTALDWVGGKVLEPLATGAGKVFTYLKNSELLPRVLNRTVATTANKDAVNAALTAGDDLTLGQITGNKTVSAVEDAMDPVKKQRTIERAQGKIKADLEGVTKDWKGRPPSAPLKMDEPLGSFPRAESGRQSAQARYNTEVGKRKAAYEKFNETRKSAPTATVLVKNPNYVGDEVESAILGADGQPLKTPSSEPKFVEQKVKEPIFMEKTSDLAGKVAGQLEAGYNDPTFIGIPGNKEGMDTLYGVVRAIQEIPRDVLGRPVQSYEASQRLYRDLASAFDSAPEGLKNRYRETIESLRNLVHADQSDSVKYWGKDAAKAHSEALLQARRVAERFYNPDVAKGLVNEMKDPNILSEKMLDDGLKDVQTARQYIHAAGGRQEIGPEFLYRILNEDYSKSTGLFKGKELLETWKQNEAMARTVLPSNVREQAEFALKRLSLVDPKVGNASLFIARVEAGQALQVSDQLVQSTFGSGKLANLAGKTVKAVTLPLSRPLVDKLFFNPEMARKVARLAVLPAESQEAKALGKVIFGGLRGMQMEIQYSDGEKQEVTIPEEKK